MALTKLMYSKYLFCFACASTNEKYSFNFAFYQKKFPKVSEKASAFLILPFDATSYERVLNQEFICLESQYTSIDRVSLISERQSQDSHFLL